MAPHADNILEDQPTALQSPVSITVMYKKRSVTLEAAPDIIVAELLPDIARRLGVLDPAIVYGGYRLVNDEDEALDPAQTILEQCIAPQRPFTLTPGALVDSDLMYDDVVEAVGSNVGQVYRAWTTAHTTITTLIICVGMLAISAVCLAVTPASVITASIGIAFAIIMLALTALLDNHGLKNQAIIIGLLSGIFAALAGFQIISATYQPTTAYGMPMLGASAGFLIAGAAMTFAAPHTRPYGFVPVIVGTATLIPSTLGTFFPQALKPAWTITATIVALIINALPWMCLSVARISVHSPQSESEIFALPKPIDYDDIRARYIQGSTYLFIGRISVAATLLICTPYIIGLGGTFAPLLCLLSFAAILLDSRQIYTLREMAITVGAAGIGILLSVLLLAATQPQTRPALAIGLLVCAIVALVFTYISRRQSLFVTRVTDAIEIICVLALPPLTYFIIAA
ncbi:ubiquitin family protein [Bifidobacterium criceti]|nr:EsaB/YukD family protein [Bifidobacterium criceti]